MQGKYTPPAIRIALAESPELAVPALRGLVNNYGTWNVRPNNIVDLMRRIEDWAYSLPQDVLQDMLLNMWKVTDRMGANNLRTAVNLMNIREAWADKTLLKKGKIPDIAAANVRMMDDLERAGLDLTGVNRRFRAAVSPYGDQRLVLQRVNSLGNALADFDTYGGLDNFSMYVTPASRKARGIHAGFSRPEPIGPSGDPAYGYKVVYQMDPSAFPVSPRVIAYSRDAGTSMSGQTTSESMSGRLGSRTGYSFFKELSGLSGWHTPLAFSRISTRTGVGWAGHSDFRSYPMSVIDNLYSTTLNPEFPSRLDFGEVKANLKVPASDFGRFMGKALIVEGKDANRTDEISRAIRSLREKLESVGVSTEEVRSDSNLKTDGRRTESEAQRASDFTMAAKGGNASESIRAAEDAGDNAPDLTGMSNFLATDRVPDTIFGIPVVSRREDYTEEDLAFFRANPRAGGYYDMGDEGEPTEGPEPPENGGPDGTSGVNGGGATANAEGELIDDSVAFTIPMEGNDKTAVEFKDRDGRTHYRIGHGFVDEYWKDDGKGGRVKTKVTKDAKELTADELAFAAREKMKDVHARLASRFRGSWGSLSDGQKVVLADLAYHGGNEFSADNFIADLAAAAAYRANRGDAKAKDAFFRGRGYRDRGSSVDPVAQVFVNHVPSYFLDNGTPILSRVNARIGRLGLDNALAGMVSFKTDDDLYRRNKYTRDAKTGAWSKPVKKGAK